MAREFWICEAEDEDHETGILVYLKQPSEAEQEKHGVYNVIHTREVLQDEIDYKAKCERYERALISISRNTCCEKGLQSKHVAKASLEGK